MKPREKKALIWGSVAVGVMVLLWLLFRKRGTGSTIIEQGGSIGLGDLGPSNFTINRGPFVINGIGGGPDSERLSAIGACCSDCASSAPRMTYAPAVPSWSIVFNEGNRGPTIHNYIQQPIVQPAPTYSLRGYSRG